MPSGASTGTFEAVELRDGGSRYNGKGVLNAVKNPDRRFMKKERRIITVKKTPTGDCVHIPAGAVYRRFSMNPLQVFPVIGKI